jgi:hypothetical protein
VIDTAPRAGDARILAGASKCDCSPFQPE